MSIYVNNLWITNIALIMLILYYAGSALCYRRALSVRLHNEIPLPPTLSELCWQGPYLNIQGPPFIQISGPSASTSMVSEYFADHLLPPVSPKGSGGLFYLCKNRLDARQAILYKYNRERPPTHVGRSLFISLGYSQVYFPFS